MSGLPITPALVSPMPLRDVPQAQPLAGQGAVAVVRTQTAAAVQQLPSASQLEALARQALSNQQDRRSRLIGPPPTFEVNLLQHLRETRMSGDDHDQTLSGIADRPAPEPRPEHSGYAQIHELSERDSADPSLQIDRTV